MIKIRWIARQSSSFNATL